MKQLIILTGIFIVFVFAPVSGFSQETKEPALSSLFASYLGLEAALVAGNADAAAGKAADMLKLINDAGTLGLTDKERKAFGVLQNKLAFDTRHISEKKEIDHQREHFAALSLNMAQLSKSVHLSGQPIYKDYCPMKKAYWLSGESGIKNPYYGDEMLTCGKTTEVIKP